MLSPIVIGQPLRRPTAARPGELPAVGNTHHGDDQFSILSQMAADHLADTLTVEGPPLANRKPDRPPARYGRCPNCRAVFPLPAACAGRRGRCRCGAILNLSRDPRPSDKAAATDERPVRPANPYLRVGVAAPFGVSSLWPVPAGYRDRLAVGCLDGYLARVSRGLAAVDLLVQHDPKTVLASTRDRSLDVWADDENVFVALCTRAAVDAVDRYPHLNALSVLVGEVRTAVGRDAYGPVVDLIEATLPEVSLVAQSNFPGTYMTPAIGSRRSA